MPASQAQPRSGHTGGQLSLIVAGAVAGLVALALLCGGGVVLWVHATQRDASGFYSTGAARVGIPTFALVSNGPDTGTGGPAWFFRSGRLGTVRVSATGSDAHPVFVGIAPRSQVAAYLRSVPHDVVSDFDIEPFVMTRTRRTGSSTPRPPEAQRFWTVSSSGAGRQTVTWPVEKGSWSIVIMNADASRGVRTAVSVGAKAPFLLWLGVALIAAGALLGVGGGAAFATGNSRRTGS